MPELVVGEKRFTEPEMCFSTANQKKNPRTHSKIASQLTPDAQPDSYCPILPGLPDDVAKYCLALVPRCDFPIMGAVCKQWRSFIRNKEFITIRKEAGTVEEWLYVLTGDPEGKGSHWEVLGCEGGEHQLLPPMPGPMKAAFGVVVLDGNLLVIAGHLADVGPGSVSADVYQYESRLNRSVCSSLMVFILLVNALDVDGRSKYKNGTIISHGFAQEVIYF